MINPTQSANPESVFGKLCGCPRQTPYGEAFCFDCTGRALAEDDPSIAESNDTTLAGIPTWQATVAEQGGYVSDFKEVGKLMQAEIDSLRAALEAHTPVATPDMVRKYPDDLATAICRLARERGTPISIGNAQACISHSIDPDAKPFSISELDQLEALAREAFKCRDLSDAMLSIAGIRDLVSELRLSSSAKSAELTGGTLIATTEESFRCIKCGEMSHRHPYRNCDDAINSNPIVTHLSK